LPSTALEILLKKVMNLLYLIIIIK